MVPLPFTITLSSEQHQHKIDQSQHVCYVSATHHRCETVQQRCMGKNTTANCVIKDQVDAVVACALQVCAICMYQMCCAMSSPAMAGT
jgi:hypothetical protein